MQTQIERDNREEVRGAEQYSKKERNWNKPEVKSLMYVV
jgi:hypothetical protein